MKSVSQSETPASLITPEMDRRNGLIFFFSYLMIYLSAPAVYVGVVQAALCDQLGASAAVANIPAATYLFGQLAPLICSWLIPHRLEKSAVIWSARLWAALVIMVLVTLLIPFPPWVRIAALAAQGLFQGVAASVAQVFSFQCLGRGTTEKGRARAFKWTFAIGPLGAVTGSLAAQYFLKPGHLAWAPFPYNFALIYGWAVPCILTMVVLSTRWQLLPLEDEPRVPFIKFITTGTKEYFASAALLLLFLVYVLFQSAQAFTPTLALHAREAMHQDPQNMSGMMLVMRFGCKAVGGYILGALACVSVCARASPPAWRSPPAGCCGAGWPQTIGIFCVRPDGDGRTRRRLPPGFWPGAFPIECRSPQFIHSGHGRPGSQFRAGPARRAEKINGAFWPAWALRFRWRSSASFSSEPSKKPIPLMFIEKLDERYLYENPQPVLRSRAAKFPGITCLPSGELLALFELGEAFESVDSRTVLSRSTDAGKTWQLQGELYDQNKLGLGFPCSETLKTLLLKDGRLMATGYRFHRKDPNQTIANPKTGGVLPADVVVTFSTDLGRNWALPRVIEHGLPEPVELSGPCIESASGDLLGTAAPFKCWDGSNPTGLLGILFRSRDKGQTWDTSGRFFQTPARDVVPFESRLIEMQPGRLVTISWAYDMTHNRNLNNHVTVSRDNGKTWSAPIDTGHLGQASNLLWLGGEQLLSIHAHREGETGLFIRLVDFTNDVWNVKDETVIWGRGNVGTNSAVLADLFWNLKFGQPSLLNLGGGELLAYHWAVEKMQYCIKIHRLRLNV